MSLLPMLKKEHDIDFNKTFRTTQKQHFKIVKKI